MLWFRFRNRQFIISFEVCAVILGIILFQAFHYLLQKRKNHKNQSKEEKMRRIVHVALCETRGGNLHIDKAVEQCINGPGYYELVDFAFVQEFKRLLGCKAKKPIILLTVRVVRAIEKCVFNRESSSLFTWFHLPQVYRWKSVLAQGIFLFLILNIVKSIVPLFMGKFQVILFTTALAINQSSTFKTITKLPNLQYVEQISPRSQRVIIKIGDGNLLFEKMGEKVLENPLIEIDNQAKMFKFEGDKSKLVPISEFVVKKILSPNKQGAEVNRVIDVRAEVKLIVKEISA